MTFISSLGACRHEGMNPVNHVTNKQITELAKKFKKANNIPHTGFQKTPDAKKDALKQFSKEIETAIKTVLADPNGHAKNKIVALTKLGAKTKDTIIKVNKEAPPTVQPKKLTPKQIAINNQMEAQRAYEKKHGIDMGGMVR